MLCLAILLLAGRATAATGQEEPPPAAGIPPRQSTTTPLPLADVSILPAEAPRGFLQVRLSGHFTYQSMLKEDFYLGGAEIYLGVEKSFWGIGGQLRLSGGHTRAGLDVFAFSLGPTVEFQLGRWVRAGFGIDLGETALFRATEPGTLSVAAVGGHGQLSVDLFHWRGGALFIAGSFAGARITAEYAPGQVGVTALLGYRLFGPPKRK